MVSVFSGIGLVALVLVAVLRCFLLLELGPLPYVGLVGMVLLNCGLCCTDLVFGWGCWLSLAG